MDAIILAVIVVVAIAGPSVLALVVYRRLNPDHRVRWRDADRELPHRDWRPGLFYMGVEAARAAAAATAAATAAALAKVRRSSAVLADP